MAPRTTSPLDDKVQTGIAALGERYDLVADQTEKLRRLLALLVSDPLAPTSIKSPEAALDDHLADSLVALEWDRMRAVGSVLDLGAGAGLPGLPLAIALPGTAFTLLESSTRKCRFMERAADACGIGNVEVVHARAESSPELRDRFDVVTARAVASLPATMEYAAPLLQVGGSLLVWQGRRDPDLDAEAHAAADELGLSDPEIRHVHPYSGAKHRHLYVFEKAHATPARFPRRPGMALKRPLARRK